MDARTVIFQGSVATCGRWPTQLLARCTRPTTPSKRP